MNTGTSSFATLCIVACLFSSVVSTANSNDSYLLSESTYRQLTAIQKLREQGKPQHALRRLQSLASRLKGNGYDYAVVLQTMGYVYHTLGRDESAAQAFEQALALDALPEQVADDLRVNLSRLLIASESYRDGLDVLTVLLNKDKNHPPEAYFLAALANYHLGHCKQTIAYLKKALAVNREAPETWYQLLLTCYYERSQYKPAARTLELMIKRFPDEDSYWSQLAGVYQRLNRNRDALAIMELAHRRHRLKAADVLRLVRLYLYLDMPYAGAQLLQSEIAAGRVDPSVENWTLLADSFYLAHEIEASIAALRSAAELAEAGQLYYRLGQMLYEREQWNEATSALQAALAKGDLEKPERAYLLLGFAALRSGDRGQAQLAFAGALEFEDTRAQASQWLKRLQTK